CIAGIAPGARNRTHPRRPIPQVRACRLRGVMGSGFKDARSRWGAARGRQLLYPFVTRGVPLVTAGFRAARGENVLGERMFSSRRLHTAPAVSSRLAESGGLRREVPHHDGEVTRLAPRDRSVWFRDRLVRVVIG